MGLAEWIIDDTCLVFFFLFCFYYVEKCLKRKLETTTAFKYGQMHILKHNKSSEFMMTHQATASRGLLFGVRYSAYFVLRLSNLAL